MQDPPRRKRLRYPGHDYRAPCIAHVTINTHHGQRLFGAVDANGMRLNTAGEMVLQALRRIHAPHFGIGLDTHIVMPDHLHAIIMLGTNPEVETTASIPDVVRDFKTRVQRTWPGGIRDGRWPPYDTHLWHRSYHDDLIEHDHHLERARAYIMDNPRRWWKQRQAESDDRQSPIS